MHNREYTTREFGKAGLRFCRKAKGIEWEAHKNVVATRMERTETHTGLRAGEGNITCFIERRISYSDGDRR